ncbi:uncharacterized protein PODANS_3_2710 [Podospora anserina S mat+]|uniref:Podospora anserina S mat+ genomic DNA chromosome 3, supercontig 2 n=1 Tax=Podospora anserina (strain S / ATCC MYA-4624 / DSM 980 / FGSC 10383) TaxID=515849 RepID=B2AZS2_PODAN|nr:uncharacterized protein PODANS_3_2710 [Podospora anserina S mat+]CAP70172.1 unnamed protein product [Podospora anserina S mat+]
MATQQAQEPYRGYNDESRAHWVLIPTILFTILCPLLLAIRIHARRATTMLDRGDWISATALLADLFFTLQFFNIATNVMFFAMVSHGFGKHSDVIPKHDLFSALQIWFFGQITHKIALHLTKVSLLLLYVRIFSHVRAFKLTAMGLIYFILLYMTSSSIVGICQCIPIASAWDLDIHGKCLNLYIIWNMNAIVSLVTDLIILVLPFPLVIRLNIPLSQKLALMPVFGLGVFIVVASALRVQSLLVSHVTDRTYDIIGTLWTIIEYNLAFVCLCLPSVRVLLVRTWPTIFKSSVGRSQTSGATAGHRYARAGGGATTWPVKIELDDRPWSRVGGDAGLDGSDSTDEILGSGEGVEAGVEPAGITRTVEFGVEFAPVSAPARAATRESRAGESKT